MYGTTETANWVAGASALQVNPRDGLVGRMWGGSAAILDGDGNRQSSGSGEILLKTPSIMQGYFKREDMTLETIRDGWFKTGDLGSIDLDGNIQITGRKKFEINSAGVKINPEDIDLLLETHPDIDEACAFAIEDFVAGEVVGVALTSENNKTIDLKALKKWCRERIVKEKLPVRWYHVPTLSKDDRGKINRAEVSTNCLAGNKETLDRI